MMTEVEAGQEQRNDDRKEQGDNAEQDHPDNSGRSCKFHFYRLVFAVNAAEEDRRDSLPFQNLIALNQFAPLPVESRFPGSVDLSARLDREAVFGRVAVITEQDNKEIKCEYCSDQKAPAEVHSKQIHPAERGAAHDKRRNNRLEPPGEEIVV